MVQHIHVGFLGGTELQGNVRTLLENVRRLLYSRESTFDCDLIVSDTIDSPAGYRKVGITHDEARTARDRIRILEQAVSTYLARESPDVVVQLTRFPTHGTALGIAGLRTNTPTITRLAGDNFREYQFATASVERIRTYILKNIIALGAVHLPTAVIALGPDGRQRLARRLRRENVWELPQPVDQRTFSPGSADQLRASLGVEPTDRLLVTVGRVSRRKGAATIEHVGRSLPTDTHWAVIGDGPMREQLSTVTNVHAVGRVPHEQIVDYYRAADLYVHPSLHDGLPNVLLEATACGTPCIARDVGECRTIAAETFTHDTELPALLDQTYEPVALDARFEENRLAQRYESMLVEVATNGR